MVQIKAAGNTTTVTVNEPARTDNLVQFTVAASNGVFLNVVLAPEACEILETSLRVARQRIVKGRK